MFFLFTFQNKDEKYFADFLKNSRIFKNFNLKTFKTHFKIFFLSFINLPCGHVMSHNKFGPDRFSRFDVYWIQTNRQTKFINILALEGASRPSSQLIVSMVFFMFIVKQNKNNLRIFTKNFVDFQNFKKFNEDRILMETNILNFDHS